MTDIETIGRTLKLVRVSAGVHQATLAAALGVTVNWLSLVENGRREPSLRLLRHWQEYFNVPLGEYLWIALAVPGETPPWHTRIAS